MEGIEPDHKVLIAKRDMHENPPVLVLNVNFEPIHVCSTHRAIGLILSGKAILVVNGRGVIRTVSRDFPRPTVIRLEHMVRRPRQSVRLTKREVLRRDNFTCQYCGQHAPILTIDHVIPRHMGGGYSWENLVTACASCNHRKGGRTIEQAHMRLLRPPHEPPTSALYYFEKHISANHEWLPFIEGW